MARENSAALEQALLEADEVCCQIERLLSDLDAQEVDEVLDFIYTRIEECEVDLDI